MTTSTQNKECPNCGLSFEEWTSYCPSCGNDLAHLKTDEFGDLSGLADEAVEAVRMEGSSGDDDSAGGSEDDRYAGPLEDDTRPDRSAKSVAEGDSTQASPSPSNTPAGSGLEGKNSPTTTEARGASRTTSAKEKKESSSRHRETPSDHASGGGSDATNDEDTTDSKDRLPEDWQDSPEMVVVFAALCGSMATCVLGGALYPLISESQPEKNAPSESENNRTSPDTGAKHGTSEEGEGARVDNPKLKVTSAGPALKVKLGDRGVFKTPILQELTPGSYKIKVKSRCFKQPSFPVEVDSGEITHLVIQPKRAFVELEVKARSEKGRKVHGKVFVDKSPVGPTWTSVRVPYCADVLEVSAEGYETYTSVVNLKNNAPNIREIRLSATSRLKGVQKKKSGAEAKPSESSPQSAERKDESKGGRGGRAGAQVATDKASDTNKESKGQKLKKSDKGAGAGEPGSVVDGSPRSEGLSETDLDPYREDTKQEKEESKRGAGIVGGRADRSTSRSEDSGKNSKAADAPEETPEKKGASPDDQKSSDSDAEEELENDLKIEF